MPETVLIRLVPPTFEVGFCPTTLQEQWNAGVSGMQAQLLVNGVTAFYNYGSTVPTPENRLFPWIRLNADGTPDDTYVYAPAGFWLTAYKMAPAGPNGFRMWYEGSADSVLTLDGGENAPASLTAGPFWEIDTNYADRIPIGAGTIAAVGVNAGESAHLMTAQEVGPHTHPIASQASFSHDGVVDVVNTSGSATDDGLFVGLTGQLTTPLSVGANAYTATQVPMPILPPVRGGYFLKRTIRRFRRI